MKVEKLSIIDNGAIILTPSETHGTEIIYLDRPSGYRRVLSETIVSVNVLLGDTMGFVEYIACYRSDISFVHEIATKTLSAIKSQNNVSITDPETLFKIGYCYYLLGDKDNTRLYFDKIPDNCPNLYLLDHILYIYEKIGSLRLQVLKERVEQGKKAVSQAAYDIVFGDMKGKTGEEILATLREEGRN